MASDGFFGGLFDFDGDGHLDDFEKAADFTAFMMMMEDDDDDEEEEDDD